MTLGRASKEAAARVAPVIGDLAANRALAGGFCEHGENGQIHNGAAVLDAAGLRAVNRKLHLCDREKLVFTTGFAPPPVLDTGRPIAVIICCDLEFPELTRSVALAGAQLPLVPTNWPLVPCP